MRDVSRLPAAQLTREERIRQIVGLARYFHRRAMHEGAPAMHRFQIRMRNETMAQARKEKR